MLCRGIEDVTALQENLVLISEMVNGCLTVRSKTCRLFVSKGEDRCRSCCYEPSMPIGEEASETAIKVEIKKEESNPGGEEEADGDREPSKSHNVKGTPKMTCDKCGKHYNCYAASYRKHVELCHGGAEAMSLEQKRAKKFRREKKGSVFCELCKVCLRPFNDQKQLFRHMAFHKAKQDLESEFDCPENKCFSKVSRLEMNTHYRSLHYPTGGVCVECFAVITEVSGHKLYRHLYNRHLYSEKKQLCITCGKRFQTRHSS